MPTDAAAPQAPGVALVVGASSGMGRAVAARLAGTGLPVAIAARRADRLAEVADEIRAAGGRCHVLEVDATDPAAVERAVTETVGALGRLDVVVNCVGTNSPRRALTVIDDDTWRELLDVNLTAAFHITRAAVAAFRPQRSGLLIHIASTAARFPDGSGVGYQASKAGVAALAAATQVEEASNGIRVSVVHPGLTNTDLVQRRPTPPDPDELAAALQPDDIAQICHTIVTLPPRVHVTEIVVRPAPLATTPLETTPLVTTPLKTTQESPR